MSELTQEHVLEVMRSQRFVMMTGVADDRSLHSHPMTPQQITDDADVYFFVGMQGEHAQQLTSNPRANLAFAEAGSWLSVAGTVEFVDDAAKVDELWNEETEAWFPEGKSDPNLGLILFRSESAQFWGTPGGKMAGLASFLKAKITGERIEATSGTTELT